MGQGLFARLREAAMLASFDGYEDDAAFANDIGFTDIVKRPTPSAKHVKPAEYEHGRELLEAKLTEYKPRLIVFTFKKTAQILFGSFAGNGFVPGLRLADSQVFVMPGPDESAKTAKATLRQLAAHVRAG